MTRIAIFDSGVGGLSIYTEIKQKLPESQYIFVSDNEAFPYGTKDENELKHRVLEVVERINAQFAPDLLVIACNTASTVVLPLLRDKFAFHIVGVVPAIKPAARLTKSNIIGLLATPATINREYTDQLINDFATECDVIKVGSSRLVQIAEDKLHGRNIDEQQIKTEIQPLLDTENIDVIVLACTHFPLLNNEISKIINVESDVCLLDSGEGIANRVVHLMTEIETKNNSPEPSVAVFTELTSLSPEFKAQLHDFSFAKTILLN